MNVSGERTFAAPRDAVWKVLNDPASMAKTMPGVESFDVHDDKRWTANVKIPLGLGGLSCAGRAARSRRRDRLGQLEPVSPGSWEMLQSPAEAGGRVAVVDA